MMSEQNQTTEGMPMKDKELIDLAARSVGGVELVPDMGWIAVDAGGNRGAWWNPLGDDGDAMRLAVQLRIDIEFDGGKVQAWFVTPRPGWDNGAVWQWTEPLGGDPYAATRRAIVHAAAEMSKTPN